MDRLDQPGWYLVQAARISLAARGPICFHDFVQPQAHQSGVPAFISKHEIMLSQRSSGILIHPTSLPSRGGIGDFGPAAYAFVDWLAAAKQTLWQVLPLGPLGYGNSPYSCTSAFAGNVLLISLERLADPGLWIASRVQALPDDDSPVDYDSVAQHKLPLLREAADKFLCATRPRSSARL